MDTHQLAILEHLKVEDSQRDRGWELKLFDLLPNSKFTLLAEEPQLGPDGMSYMLVEVAENSDEPAQRMLSWLSDKGIGLVLNPQKEFPDFIFTYGMIWNFKERQLFSEGASKVDENSSSLEPDELVVGEPSEEFLPNYARTIIKQFFLEQGVYDPRFILVGRDLNDMELCFSLESLGSPDKSEHQGVLQALSWFLPNHYKLAMGSQADLPRFYSV